MEVDRPERTSSPSLLARHSPATLERANKPPHLHLGSTSNTPSAVKARAVAQAAGGDVTQSNRSMQAPSRFGILLPQVVQGRKMMVIEPRREGSDTQESAYVLDSRGSSLPPNIPRTLPPFNTQPDSTNSSASSGQMTDRTLSRPSSNASLASIDHDLKRPRSRTINLPSISQLFPGEEGRASKMQRLNPMPDHSTQPSQTAQMRKANRPRSLSDVVLAKGRGEPSFLRPGHRLIHPVPSANGGHSATARQPAKAAFTDNNSPADKRQRPPPPIPPIAASLPLSHAHNSSTQRFRCPLYSCGGKMAPHQSKVKAALLKCQDCERLYWQVGDTPFRLSRD